MLAHELNHRSRPCLQGKVACQVFHQAKPALKVYTLRKRKETLDWIHDLVSPHNGLNSYLTTPPNVVKVS